jgi:hypothetical protein
MSNLASLATTPATSIVTTAETLAQNVPAGPLNLPGGAPANVIVRVTVWITTGTGVTALAVKLRTGQNNTTTGQIGSTAQDPVIASTLQAVTFVFIDPNGGVNYPAGGYSITVSQVGATGNGTVTAVNSEVDITIP